MSRERVKEALTQYLRNPPPGYAFLLEGSWGVGKSHFWRHFKDTGLSDLRRNDITMSVAGLSTREDLENALFLASVENLAPQLLREAATVIWKAALRVVKVDPSDIKLKADVIAGVTVVCLDDVERFIGDFKVLFGFIKGLLDDAKLHVVLIGDEKRAGADLPSYNVYRERIVGKAITLPPDISAVYEDVASGYLNPLVRKALKDAKPRALMLFTEKNLTNMRTLRAILDEVNALLGAMTSQVDHAPRIDSLFTAVTFHSMSVAKDSAAADEVAKVFLMDEMTLAAALRGAKKNEQKADTPEQANAKKSWRELIQDLAFTADVYAWPSSAAFATYVSGGTLDANGIASDFKVFEDHNAKESLLKQLESYRTMDDNTFNMCIEGLKREVEGHELSSLQQVWQAWSTLSHLSWNRLTPWSVEQCKDFFLEAIRTYDPTGPVHAAMEKFDRATDDHDQAVWEALVELEKSIRTAEETSLNLQLQKALVEGVGEWEQISASAPFTSADAQGIHNRLMLTGREGVLRVTKFYARLPHRGDVNARVKDVPFAKSLADIIERKVPAGKLNLDQAAWQELLEKIRDFIKWVGTGRPEVISGM